MEPLSSNDSSPREVAVANISAATSNQRHRHALLLPTTASDDTNGGYGVNGHYDQRLLLHTEPDDFSSNTTSKAHKRYDLHMHASSDAAAAAYSGRNSIASLKSFLGGGNASARSSYAGTATPPLPSHRHSTSSLAATSSSMREKLSVTAVIVHLLKGNIGPGAMSLPNGFSQTGIYAAPVLFVFVALVSVYNMDLLLYCKRMVAPNNTRMSFGDVGFEILGPPGKLLIDVFLVGTQLGICCVYFTFIATNIHVVLPDAMQHAIHERHLIVAIFPILLLLSWLRTLKRITPFSGLANVAVISGIAIVFYYSIEYEPTLSKPRIEPVRVDWSAIPAFYGTAVYSFEGIGLVLPIQNEMLTPTLFPRILAIVMLVILLLFLVIGELPTIAFGRIANGSMTAVLHDYCSGWGVLAANALLAFACTLSFPIQFYPAIQVLEKSLGRPGSLMRPAALPQHPPLHRRSLYAQSTNGNGPRTPDVVELDVRASLASSTASRPLSLSHLSVTATPPIEQTKRPLDKRDRNNLPTCVERVLHMSQYECTRTLFRSMLCTVLMLVAICIPDVGLLISLFGAVGSSMLAIVIPPVLYVALHKRSGALSLASRIGHYAIISVGLIGMVAGTVQAVVDIVKSFK